MVRDTVILLLSLFLLFSFYFRENSFLPFEDDHRSTVHPHTAYVEVVDGDLSRVYPIDYLALKYKVPSSLKIGSGDALHLVSGEVRPSGKMRGGERLLLGLPVNINEDSVEDLADIPGLGLKQALALVAFREREGLFGSIDSLVRVKGIGGKTLEKIRPYVAL